MRDEGSGRDRRRRWAGAAVMLAACSNADSSRMTTGLSGGVSASGAATDVSSSGTTLDATGSSDGGGTTDAADSSGDPGPTIAVHGVVIDFGTITMQPTSGASVSVWGDPDNSTTTDGSGVFELTVPAGGIEFLEVGKPDFWGALIRLDTTQGDVDVGEINIANHVFIETKVAAFTNFDLGKGAVIGRSTATDTTLSLLENGMPATAMDEYFSIDAQVNFTLGDNVTRSSGFPAVVFFDLEDKQPGVLTMSAMHPNLACAVAGPTPPIQATTISWIEIACM